MGNHPRDPHILGLWTERPRLQLGFRISETLCIKPTIHRYEAKETEYSASPHIPWSCFQDPTGHSSLPRSHHY